MSQMVTTCANCRQQLAVTAADLRVGQGYVRCGRCDKVFNALLTLAEDEPAPTEPDSVAHGTRSVPTLEEDDLPPMPGREEPIPFGSSDEDEVEVVQTHVTGHFRSIVLEGDAGVARESDPEGESLPLPTPESTARAPEAPPSPDDAVARDILRQATSQPIDVLLEDSAQPAVPAAVIQVTRTDLPEGSDFDAAEALGSPRRASPLWTLAAVVLALLLLAQWVHHERARLVTVSWLQQPLRAVYGLFGQSVDPAWDLGRYEVQQLGSELRPGAPGNPAGRQTLVLQAAVAVNKDAPWAQPPPVLRVVLSDQWGNDLTTTDVPPRDWMLGEAPAHLTPGQRVDARLSLPAPERVSGFSLSPCLPDDQGALRCRDGS